MLYFVLCLLLFTEVLEALSSSSPASVMATATQIISTVSTILSQQITTTATVHHTSNVHPINKTQGVPMYVCIFVFIK